MLSKWYFCYSRSHRIIILRRDLHHFPNLTRHVLWAPKTQMEPYKARQTTSILRRCTVGWDQAQEGLGPGAFIWDTPPQILPGLRTSMPLLLCTSPFFFLFSFFLLICHDSSRGVLCSRSGPVLSLLVGLTHYIHKTTQGRGSYWPQRQTRTD